LLDNVKFAYSAWRESPWHDRVPEEMFFNYILPYACVDERRDDWREDLVARFKPLVAGVDEPGAAAVALNQKIFPLLKVRFAADRTTAHPLSHAPAGR
jgi:hypothetical protein